MTKAVVDEYDKLSGLLFDGPVVQGWITDLCVDVCMRDLYFENPELLEGGGYVSADIRHPLALGSHPWKLRIENRVCPTINQLNGACYVTKPQAKRKASSQDFFGRSRKP
jgi:hypothetical protein